MDKMQQIKSRNSFKLSPKSNRPFSIEKIAKSINCGHLINSIKYKYIDPKIKRKKEIIQRNKIPKKIQDKLDEEMYSSPKIRYHKYKNIKQPILNSLSFSESNNNNYLKKKNSEFILPLIIKNKKINESYNKAKKEDNNLISTSGMMNRKRLFNLKKSKMTISALLNILNDKNEILIEKEYKSLDDIHNINEKYNINLNLKNIKEKNSNNTNNIYTRHKYKRKLNKNGLLAYLFNKYSAVNNKKNYSEKKEEKDMDENSSNLSFDMGKEIAIINYNSNNSISNSGNTFLTKLTNKNDNIDINKIINRHNNLILSIKKNNHKIIDKDKNIYINCLLSNAQNELNKDKILYRNNGKTIYELDKDFSYKRLKHFENIINKLFAKND